MFDTIEEEDIVEGLATDEYFLRTEEALRYSDKNPTVVADISADQFANGEREVLAGVNEAVSLLAEISDGLDVWVLPEGTLFDGCPVLRIKGPYLEFARYETSILGFLSQASGIATKAFETTRAADEYDATVLSFGARHVHPSISAVVERSSLIGGVDGFSHVAAGRKLGKESSGTMPHALMLCFGEGNQEEAWTAFDEAVPEETKRIPLCDTFTDEVDEVRRAVATLGDDIDGVRLDTTGSRRGDFRHIIKEVRWALEVEGYDNVPIFVSGGITPDDIEELGDVADGFGVGSYISTADPVDFSLDIVQKDGEPITKRGKKAGIKGVSRDGEVFLTDDPSAGMFTKVVADGEQVEEFSIEKANKRLNRHSSYLNKQQTETN